MYKRISKTAYKQTFNPEPLRKCWKQCLEKSSFYPRKLAAEEFNKKNYWKKRGLAVVPMKFTIGFPVAYYNQVRMRVSVFSPEALSHTTGCLKTAIVCNQGWPAVGRKKKPRHIPIAGNKAGLGSAGDPRFQSRSGTRGSESSRQMKSSSSRGLTLGRAPGMSIEVWGLISNPSENWEK